jgi:lipopolysaccharide/colanic/teichoic acid biosynthesis glycosyltransferase
VEWARDGHEGVDVSLAIKRLMDIVLSATGLVVLSPVLALIAVRVRQTMGSPVLFRQVRPGRDGRPFEVLKFRTMRDAIGPDGKALLDRDRITSLGRTLRRTSFDELPELWNILKGDMSLVGPRPLLMEYLELYTPIEARRHEVRPGLTGWAQVHGRRTLGMPERLMLDVWYVDHWSLWLDIRVLAMTVKLVLSGAGVEPDVDPGRRFRTPEEARALRGESVDVPEESS